MASRAPRGRAYRAPAVPTGRSAPTAVDQVRRDGVVLDDENRSSPLSPRGSRGFLAPARIAAWCPKPRPRSATPTRSENSGTDSPQRFDASRRSPRPRCGSPTTTGSTSFGSSSTASTPRASTRPGSCRPRSPRRLTANSRPRSSTPEMRRVSSPKRSSSRAQARSTRRSTSGEERSSSCGLLACASASVERSAPEPRESSPVLAPVAAVLLSLGGAAAFVVGATLGPWPLWAFGAAALCSSLLVYRP